MKTNKQNITIICVGLAGCLLTSLASSTAVMLFKGWELQGGVSELFYRMCIGYPSACLVVISIFPYLVPRLTKFLEKKLS